MIRTKLRGRDLCVIIKFSSSSAAKLACSFHLSLVQCVERCGFRFSCCQFTHGPIVRTIGNTYNAGLNRQTDMAATGLERCIDETGHWIDTVCLRLNAGGAEVVLTGKESLHLDKLTLHWPSLVIRTRTVDVSVDVLLLGVWVSHDMSLTRQREPPLPASAALLFQEVSVFMESRLLYAALITARCCYWSSAEVAARN